MPQREVFKTNNQRPDFQVAAYQYDDLRFREAGGEQLSDGKNSSCNLLCCVFVVVGSDP